MQAFSTANTSLKSTTDLVKSWFVATPAPPATISFSAAEELMQSMKQGWTESTDKARASLTKGERVDE